MDAASIIRTARVRRGLTQAELARRAGTSQPVISAFEHGTRDPTSTTLRRVVAATGERLEWSLRPTAVPDPGLATKAEHARALVDVLLLAEAIPLGRRPPPLAMPPMLSTHGSSHR